MKLMENSEASSLGRLLEQARAGDRAAMDDLFRACRGYLGVVAEGHVGSRLQAKVDASDVVQQTLLEAHRDFQRFRGSTGPEWLGWLREILSHNAADFVRRYHGTEKRAARREVPLRRESDDSSIGGALEPADRGDSPSQQLMRRERELAVADALEKLTPDHREVVLLRNIERLPFDEVARRMGRSRPAAQMLWMRAIRKLQEVMPSDAQP